MSSEASQGAAPLVEHYVSVGAPSQLTLLDESSAANWLDRVYAPEILTTYPPSRPLPSKVALAAFCLPSGVRLSPARRPPNFSCFVLTMGDGGRLYGHSLAFDEPLDPAALVQLPPPLPDPDAADADADADAGGSAAAAPASATVAALSGGAAVFAPRCLCVLSRGHFPLAFKASLSALLSMVGGAPQPLPLETALSHLVLNVPAPRPGGPGVRFAVGAAGHAAPPLHVCCAPAAELPATDYSLGVLLERLTPNALLDLFGALLLEQQIVVVGGDAELRVAACELLLQLIFPLRWVSVRRHRHRHRRRRRRRRHHHHPLTATRPPPPGLRADDPGRLAPPAEHAAPLRPRSRAPPARCAARPASRIHGDIRLGCSVMHAAVGAAADAAAARGERPHRTAPRGACECHRPSGAARFLVDTTAAARHRRRRRRHRSGLAAAPAALRGARPRRLRRLFRLAPP